MHEVDFGKGERFPGQSSGSLADGAVEPFDVIGGATILALLQLVSENY